MSETRTDERGRPMHRVRVIIRPDEELWVSDEEYADLRHQGLLVADGTAQSVGQPSTATTTPSTKRPATRRTN